jgi:transposase
MQVTTIGLDLAKRVFQVHGVDADGRVVMQRKLQRGEVAAFFADLPSCRVGIEACATAHHWARLIGATGHEVRLIPPSYVKPSSQQDRCRGRCAHQKIGLVRKLSRPLESASSNIARPIAIISATAASIF